MLIELCMHPPRGLLFWFSNFKMFYLLNRKSKPIFVFTISFVAPRSSKGDPMLICFDNIFSDPSCQIIVTWSPWYCHVSHHVKIEWLPDFLNFATHQHKSFLVLMPCFTWLVWNKYSLCERVNHCYERKICKVYPVTVCYLNGYC